MALSAGTRLGPYEILEPLGAGGMGEVYRARDGKLGRDVAIKVLPTEVAQDPERLSRFQREATLLAALNHPHIAAIYGLEESGGDPFLVLELVEGEDLAERLKRGPIPVGEALEIARQIAEGLEEAHEKGIIHRDLKPANVKVTPEGKVKVLDFGLAKAWEADPISGGSGDVSRSPTLAYSGTQAGVILGTAAYMSPEQARGKVVDRRADVWAFGVLLYEMLVGGKLFGGETATDIIASVVKEQPDWERLPEDTPRVLRSLLRRCLVKDPRQRLRDNGDARLELAGVGDVDGPSPVEAPRRSRLGTAALAALATIASGVALWSLSRGSDPPPAYRLSIPLPEGHALTSGPALSYDGQLVAFTSTDGVSPARLYVRSLTDAEVRPLPGTEGAEDPFFSPDGSSLAFFAKGVLWRTSSEGGAPLRLADAPAPAGGTWGEDDSIVFVPTWNGGLYRVHAGGGEPELLLRPEAGREYACVMPRFLPGGGGLLIQAKAAKAARSRGCRCPGSSAL